MENQTFEITGKKVLGFLCARMEGMISKETFKTVHVKPIEHMSPGARIKYSRILVTTGRLNLHRIWTSTGTAWELVW